MTGMVMGIASIGGQVVGGALIGADLLGLGWRWVFLIKIPIGTLAFGLAPRLIAESRADRTSGMDTTGAGLLTLALTLLVLPLIDGRQNGWPPWAWAALAASPCCIAAFGIYERHLARSGRSPLLDMHLFRERTFSAGLATKLALWCGQASFFFVLALYLQQARGLTPLHSGLVLMIAACSYTAASLRAPTLTARYGRELIAVGALTLAVGHASLLVAVHGIGARGDLALLAPGLLLVGAGMDSASPRSQRQCSGAPIRNKREPSRGRSRPCNRSATPSASPSPALSSSAPPSRESATPLSSAWPNSPFS